MVRERKPDSTFSIALRLVGVLQAVAGLWVVHAGPAQAAIEAELLAGMKARAIGPAGMSGRVTAIDAVVSDPRIVYVGSASGGLWKSLNGGLTWEPVFDDQPVASVGAVAVFQPNPAIVWVGTGEGNPRNSASIGNGVYRSLDGGQRWVHLGLEATERIHRIVLHPSDPEVAWVAALGRAWADNPERGVFRTTDGGRTWRKVLYVDEKTGAAELVMDPSNPNHLLAAMWQYRRWPWFFQSGGPGSGLYRSVDGGESWERLTAEDGLPEGELGRIGVSFCHRYPEIVYAIVEAERSALLKSEDGGRHWVEVNVAADVSPRPFYYADIRVDPEWPQRVYNLWSLLSVSDDGGKSFRVLAPFRLVHPDYHAMWIHPQDPSYLIVGNDGGVAFSRDRGETWRFVENLPLAQFYHIAVDMDVPYHIYGGMQDNGSWRGPSAVWENFGIRNHHWEEVGFGDGFDTRPDPRDSLQGYSMSQEGYLRRWNLRTGERKDIRPPAPEGVELRFNWNAALAVDPFEPETIYYGSQFVHRSTDRGDTWTIISPDLTTNNPDWQKQAESGGLTPDVTGAENYTTIVAIAPSRLRRGLIWVGTDDGRIHLTRDGGATWTSLEDRLRGAPRGSWVPYIEPSPHDEATAFLVLDNHRRSDFEPYVYKTADFGRSWQRLATDTIEGYALAIVQDPGDPDLLFLGTEFGLHVSLDGGRHWFKWTHGVPTVSVMDLVVHPRDHDLVLGTHGRGAYVLDDIGPLRGLTEAVLREPLHLFSIPDAQQYRVKQTGQSRFPGHGEFRGENRPYGALVTFSLNIEGLPSAEELEQRLEQQRQQRIVEPSGLERGPAAKKRAKERERAKIPKAEILVFDRQGRRVRRFETAVHRGVNRAVWNLRSDPFREPPRERPWWREEPEGPEVLPDRYTVEVRFGAHAARGELRVLPDPRSPVSDGDRRAAWEAIQRTGRAQERVADAVARIHDARADIEVVLRKLEEAVRRAGEANEAWSATQDKEQETPEERLRRQGGEMFEALEQLERKLWVPPRTKGIVAEKDPFSKLDYVMGALSSSWEAPTPAHLAYLAEAEALLEKVLRELDAFFEERVEPFWREVRARGLELGRTPSPGPPPGAGVH